MKQSIEKLKPWGIRGSYVIIPADVCRDAKIKLDDILYMYDHGGELQIRRVAEDMMSTAQNRACDPGSGNRDNIKLSIPKQWCNHYGIKNGSLVNLQAMPWGVLLTVVK